jgi:3-oxoacyl-[acyl-carrier-protein] synthase-1
MGSGGASNQNVVEAADILREKSIKRVGPYRVPRTMGNHHGLHQRHERPA